MSKIHYTLRQIFMVTLLNKQPKNYSMLLRQPNSMLSSVNSRFHYNKNIHIFLSNCMFQHWVHSQSFPFLRSISRHDSVLLHFDWSFRLLIRLDTYKIYFCFHTLILFKYTNEKIDNWTNTLLISHLNSLIINHTLVSDLASACHHFQVHILSLRADSTREHTHTLHTTPRQ